MSSLPALIARLESATEGSRELDADIAIAIGIPATTTIGDDIIVKQRQVPNNYRHYTTSLDAKLPGEDIRQVVKGDGYYAAFQARPDKVGQHWIGEAATEALARRVAALKNIKALKAAGSDNRE